MTLDLAAAETERLTAELRLLLFGAQHKGEWARCFFCLESEQHHRDGHPFVPDRGWRGLPRHRREVAA